MLLKKPFQINRLYLTVFYVYIIGGDSFIDDQEEVASILQRAHQSRRAAENVSKHLLQKLDKTFGVTTCGRHSPPRPWEDLSSTSKTARWVK